MIASVKQERKPSLSLGISRKVLSLEGLSEQVLGYGVLCHFARMLETPQGSPFAVALESATYVLVVPNRQRSIYTRRVGLAGVRKLVSIGNKLFFSSPAESYRLSHFKQRRQGAVGRW